MKHKIGEIFEFKKDWYQCVEGRCKDCHFSEKRFLCKQFITKGFCNSNIIFKKLEKVGEPYKFQKRIIQTYKLYIEPFISVDMDFIWAYVRGNNTIDIIIKQTKEDMEENKLNLKPFDIQKAREGKPVCTRDGRKARIICFDKKCLHEQVLIALVDCGKEESIYFYTTDGKCIDDFSSFDLMMLPEKKEGWVVIRKGDIYETEELAEKELLDSQTAIMIGKISWEE